MYMGRMPSTFLKSYLSFRSSGGRAAKPAFPQPASSRTPLPARLTLDVGAQHDSYILKAQVTLSIVMPQDKNWTLL